MSQRGVFKVGRGRDDGETVGRKLDIDLLITARQIAERLHVRHVQTIHTWRRRHADFPEPVRAFDGVLIWYWPDVKRWARRTGRLPAEGHGA